MSYLEDGWAIENLHAELKRTSGHLDSLGRLLGGQLFTKPSGAYPKTSGNKGWQRRVSRFGQRHRQICQGWSCDHGQLYTLESDVVPINLQVETNVSEDLSDVQSIPARRQLEPPPGSRTYALPYICGQILIAISPDRRLVFVETRRGTVIRRPMGTTVRQVLQDLRECHEHSVSLTQ
jgi:hypothetical protein